MWVCMAAASLHPTAYFWLGQTTIQTIYVMLQLQQDADFQHWGVDFGAVHQRAQELGIDLIRRPVCIALHIMHINPFTVTASVV